MNTWTVAINGKVSDTGYIRTFTTKKACQAYIKEVYFGSLNKLVSVRPVKIKIEIV